jgi:hypothetical protein
MHPYFKVSSFGERFSYRMDRTKETKEHVYRVIKPYPMNSDSKKALGTS